MIIYISGPMTGFPEHNFPAFNAEAARLREMGYTVINPAEIDQDDKADWGACMIKDLKVLLDCDVVAVLPGWEKSSGARLEVLVARAVGMIVVSADSFIHMREVKL